VQHQQDDHTQKGALGKSSRTLNNMGQHNSTTIHYNDGALELIGCCNPTLKECEDETHPLEMKTWESSGTSETSEFDCKGQNTSHWGVLYIIGSY